MRSFALRHAIQKDLNVARVERRIDQGVQLRKLRLVLYRDGYLLECHFPLPLSKAATSF